MSQNDIQDQALALAGVAQFATNAHNIASHGNHVPEYMDTALSAIFCTDPTQAADVIPRLDHIQDGVRLLGRQVGRTAARKEDAHVAGNMGQIARLAGRLMKKREALTAIRAAIDRARLADAEQAPRILDEAYQANISPIPPQIMVHGHPTYLNNTLQQQRIRTHLLAAIRCAILWRQCGGRFWRLVIMRRRFDQALRQLETEDGHLPK